MYFTPQAVCTGLECHDVRVFRHHVHEYIFTLSHQIKCSSLKYQSAMLSPLPTVTPNNSSNPLLKIASTSKRAKNPIMAALLFKISAFSTKPNFGGGTIGERGGCVTPFGGPCALTHSLAPLTSGRLLTL